MFYKKGLNISHAKDMWNFLKNHYTYYTMSSWNKLKSIAHNVKAYDLPFRNDYQNVLIALEESNYDLINDEIRDWELEHPTYEVGFNGRNGGYLVLGDRNNFCNILPSFITDYDSYADFKSECVVKDYIDELRFYTQLVQDFDKLCDHLVDVADDVCDQMLADKAEEERRESFRKEFTTIKCEEKYEYETEEYARLHERYMLFKGYNATQKYYGKNKKFYIVYVMRDLIKDSVIDD